MPEHVVVPDETLAPWAFGVSWFIKGETLQGQSRDALAGIRVLEREIVRPRRESCDGIRPRQSRKSLAL